MAIGDAAAAKGLATFPSTQDKRLGYQNDNQRGDELAAEIDARAAAIATLTSSKLDASKVIIQTATPAVVTGGIWFKPV